MQFERLLPALGGKSFQPAFMTYPALVACAALIVACGGSGSSPVAVSGTAATGAAMQNAAIAMRCVTGSGTATTDAAGGFTVYAYGVTTPCLLEASNGSTKLHSVVTAESLSANSATANITPLTEQLVAALDSSAVDTVAFFKAFDGTKAPLLSASNVATAHNAVLTSLTDAGLNTAGVSDLIKAPLIPRTGSQTGNAYDQLLDTVAATPVAVKLIALNDFHGNFQEPSSTNGGTVTLANGSSTKSVSVGGAAYIASALNSLRAANPNNITVGAGDLMAASPFASAINHDESTVDILSQMGVEVSSVGNHEFDRGITELKRIQNGGCYPAAYGQGVVGVDTCLQTGGTFSGARYKYLAANVTDTATGKPVLPATYIKRFGTVSVGFIGLTFRGTVNSVGAGGVAGLSFEDEATVINNYASKLKAQGVTAVAVLIHQGGQTTASTFADPTCPGFSGDISAILNQLNSSVDLVVSGHTHQEYVCNFPSTSAGKNILLTSTGFYGQALSEINLTLKPGAGLVSASARTVPVIKNLSANLPLPTGFSAYDKDSTIDALVTRYTNLSTTAGQVVVGSVTGDIKRALLSNGTRDETNESALANVMADSYLTGVPGFTADVAFVNPGSVRADILSTVSGKTTGTVLYSELATIEPFGNTLMSLNLTGAQIARLLEEQWEAPNHTAKTNPAAGTVGRILGVSSGFSYTYNNVAVAGAAKGSGARVVSGSIRINGAALDPTRVYRVVTNSYMATGTAPDNFTIMATQGTNKLDTKMLDLDAFIAYFRANPNLASPAARVTRVN